MDEAKITWGRDLPGDLTDKWPRDDSGEPITPAYLGTYSQMDMADTVLISMLDAYGIPCIKRFPHYGGFGNFIIGMSAEGVELFIPETMLADAKALMEGEITENEEL